MKRPAGHRKTPAPVEAHTEAPEPVSVAPAQEEEQQQAPETKKISFSVWVTREQLAALNKCLKDNGIKFEQIRN